MLRCTFGEQKYLQRRYHNNSILCRNRTNLLNFRLCLSVQPDKLVPAVGFPFLLSPASGLFCRTKFSLSLPFCREWRHTCLHVIVDILR